MKHNYKILFLFFPILLFSQNGLIMNDNEDFVKVRFTSHSNLIILPITLNGKSLNFILDSGSKQNLILNKSLVYLLDTVHIKQITIKGLGNKQDILAFISSNNVMKVGELYNNNAEILILVNVDLDLSAKIGITIHGILGSDAFKNYIVEINYNTSTIKFRKKITKKIKKKFQAFSITIERDKPFIHGSVIIDSTYPNLKFLIDTGSSDALWLFDNTKIKLKYPGNYFEDILGVGIGGDITGRKSKIKKFSINNFAFLNPVISIPDSNSIKNIVELYPNRNGSIGGNILKRFITVFDYNNKKLYLKKSRFYKSAFLYDMSGLTIYKPYPNVPLFEVYTVRKNSPAEKADIKKGDIITEINSQKVFSMDFDTILNLFKAKKNKIISITIERNGNLFYKEIMLLDILSSN